jgi:hypothetical protein
MWIQCLPVLLRGQRCADSCHSYFSDLPDVAGGSMAWKGDSMALLLLLLPPQ